MVTTFMNIYAGSLQQRLLYCESSPVVSRNTDQMSSDILFLSGDDDLFEWDEDDMPARPNEKPSSPSTKVSLLNHNLILYGIRKTKHILQKELHV